MITPTVIATKISATRTVGHLHIQRTYFCVRFRKRFGSKTWKGIIMMSNPSAFCSAVRRRASLIRASSCRLRSATDCWSSAISRSISSYSPTMFGSIGSLNRAWYASWIWERVRVPSKSWIRLQVPSSKL
jgi:hypothetical protein